MNRQRFLSLAGLSFIGTVFSAFKKQKQSNGKTACNDPVTPPVPEGPYYKNEHLKRVDIREQKAGLPVEYIFTVHDKECRPVQNAIVDIWQCDVHGHYSDFKAENSEGQTWLRGHQYTNERGQCRFASIFPGWYDGRLTHLHAKVHVDNTCVLTTNLFFPKDTENEVYALTDLYPKGPNPVTIKQDFELRGDADASRHDHLLMTMSKDKSGKLKAHYTIVV